MSHDLAIAEPVEGAEAGYYDRWLLMAKEYLKTVSASDLEDFWMNRIGAIKQLSLALCEVDEGCPVGWILTAMMRMADEADAAFYEAWERIPPGTV